jgi:hypothetical protein
MEMDEKDKKIQELRSMLLTAKNKIDTYKSSI